jgi:hypothetical protein
MKKIAFVIPWYGENIPGGAETALRGLAKHLHRSGVPLEILTTCGESSLNDWSTNFHRPGGVHENGIFVRRFPLHRRDVAAFDAVNYKLLHNNMPIAAEEEAIYAIHNIRERNDQ